MKGRSSSARSFAIADATEQALAYVYFEDEPGRRRTMKRLTPDEARRIAVNIARLPSCCGQELNRCSSLARTSSLSSPLWTSRSMGKSGGFRHRTLQRVMICRDAISSQCCSAWRQAEY
jgi:hypothetical protein